MNALLTRQSGGARWLLLEAVALTLAAASLLRLEMVSGGWFGPFSSAIWIYIPLMMIVVRRLEMERYGFALTAWRSGWKWLLLSILFVLIPFAILEGVYLGIVEQPAGPAAGLSVGRLGIAEAFYQLAFVAVPEELFFRGYLQTRIAEWAEICGLSHPAIPILFAALLFALAHLVVEPGLHRAAVFFPGAIMGWLKYRSGGLLAPTGFHWLANLLQMSLA